MWRRLHGLDSTFRTYQKNCCLHFKDKNPRELLSGFSQWFLIYAKMKENLSNLQNKPAIAWLEKNSCFFLLFMCIAKNRCYFTRRSLKHVPGPSSFSKQSEVMRLLEIRQQNENKQANPTQKHKTEKKNFQTNKPKSITNITAWFISVH